MLPPHPNIIRVINSWTESDIVQYLNPSIPPGPEKYHFIQMEYCSQGDLRNWLNHRELTHETDADQIFRQIISALAHLHGVQPKAIIHRDVKPENIFMQKDRNIKLGDFGLSREIDKFDMTSRTGTSFYKAPELVRKCIFHNEVAIIILCQLIIFYVFLENSTWENVRRVS